MALLDFLPRFFKSSSNQRQAVREPAQTTNAANATFPDRHTPHPISLSPEQKRCWFLAQLSPRNVADHLAVGIRLRGPLDRTRLERSFHTVVERHDALNVIFAATMGEPKQYIVPGLRFPFSLTDIQNVSAANRPEKIEAFLRTQMRIPFQLHGHPLLRGHLLCMTPRDHILLLVGHVLIVDQYSLRQCIEELVARYNGQELPIPSYQYKDFWYGQAAWLQSKAGQAARHYWTEHLADSQTLLELPTDHPRPPQPSLQGGQHELDLTNLVKQRLQKTSNSTGYAPDLILLAAWVIFLFRYTNQHDILLGTTVTNRDEASSKHVVGPCHNQLVLRAQLASEQTGRQLLKSLKQVMANAKSKQLPFAELIELLQPVREISHTPLFQVLFLWENVLTIPILENLECEWLDVFGEATRYDLTLSFTRTEYALDGKIIYNADLFSAATITRMAAQYQQLVTALLDDLDKPAGQLSLLPPAQRAKLLHLWNDTKLPYPQNWCIHHYFEKQAAQTPSQIGLYADGRFWHYQELNQRANQLAHYLLACGVEPGDLLGVCLGRSADLLIALLAILKVGAAYVPLDPEYPVARIAYIVEDARITLLLTRHTQQFASEFGTTCLYLDDVQEAVARQPDVNLQIPLSSSSLAYLIYTSGSTGRPKGVEITHRNGSAFISWARAHFSGEELTAVLASTSICFDLSIFELFVPLAAGGCVVLVQNILDLVDQLPPIQLTLINTVPSAAAELVRANAFPPSVLTVNLAGEPFRYQLAHQLYILGAKRVYNLYGPSEYTTYTTWALLDVDASETERPPIGRPIANTQIYLLDEQQQPVPVGVLGEIYIGGEGLARGYLHRPELTRQKFIPSPFDPQQRLYRTGDLARYRPDGQLEFIGRQDHQIKLRGYRIELGEIETVLEQHPAVRETAVVVRKPSPDTPLLVAYLAPSRPATSTLIAEIRHFLEEKLPNYMIPAHLHILPALPRTPNGKIDRQNLPQLTPAATEPKMPESGDPITDKLKQIWQEVLGVPFVRTTDDFFELGGNSLLAVRLMARIEQEFGQKLPLSTLF